MEAYIRVLLLGVAAGGGLPQWNCACFNCQQARRGGIEAQTQSSIAVGDEAGNWFLINASPDLPLQMRFHAELWPQPRDDSPRNCPIAAVFLTSADVDHILGLLTLREGNALHIHATAAMEQSASILGVTAVLRSFCGVVWHHPEDVRFSALLGNDGRESSLCARLLPLSGRAPRYAAANAGAGVHTVAWQFMDQRTGGRLLVAPGVASWSGPLEEAARESDAVLLDGTFWSEDELRRVRPGAPGASEMGHLYISGATGTLAILAALPSRHRVYVHINNTNPVFAPGSPERAAVEAAGVKIGCDGMTLDL